LGARANLFSSSEFSEDRPPSRLLIVCVDRDNDVEVKTGIKTPITGKDACLNAATKLALSDPEEADANAIFAAIKEYDDLLSKGEHCEVVVVGGLFERGTLGDKKIRKEVADTLKDYPADGIVLVSDGVEGEEIVPVIQSLAPIISIKRVVIKHSESVEESYQVLGRYFRMLLFDPRYARYALGIPGIIFIAFVLIYVVSQQAAPLVLTIFVGIIFLIRGFDIDRKVESIGKLPPTGLLRLFSAIVSILVILVGIATGIAAFYSCGVTTSTAACTIAENVAKNPQSIVSYAPRIIGYFIQNSEILVWLGFAVYITTTVFFTILRAGSRRIARYLVELSVLALLYFPVSIFASTLITPGGTSNDLFIAIVMFALAVNFSIAAYVFSYINRRRRGETSAIEV
jgi:putative membrane protein